MRPMPPSQSRGVEIVGPFNLRELVVDGWSVPFVQAVEVDGGRVHFMVDRRFGFDVSAGDFEQAARLVAYAVAVAIGLPCHPRGDEDKEMVGQHAHIHMALRPRRMHSIDGVKAEDIEPEPSNDPRDDVEPDGSGPYGF
jgi:hypothetical protein